MSSSYDMGRSALALWREIHGNTTLDQECIRYDGYYWQWAYQGDERIQEYPSATAAANASPMYTDDVNDADAEPGDLWYYWWTPDGHVGTVLGHDEDGRVLITHTSSSGDLVEQWSNNVRISHADTIPHKFRGGSHHYGVNKRRTGLTVWPAKPKPKPVPDPVSRLGDLMAFKSVGIGYRPDVTKDRLITVGLDFESGQRTDAIVDASYGTSWYGGLTEGGFKVLTEGHYFEVIREFEVAVAEKRAHELALARASAGDKTA